MMRNCAIVLLFASLLASVSVPARAVICTIDEVPAATLLLPYFEVDLANQWGNDTVFSVNNASATAVLAHVVLWSDLSVPVLDFNIYLTGYDVQTVNLRDVLLGHLPQTASAGQDPDDTISPKGQFSQDINFASCNNLLPPPLLPQSFVDHLRLALTGQASPVLGGCAGRAFGDNIARGYLTIDTVNACTLLFPGDAGYFQPGGTGFATDQNVLWGDYFYINDGLNFADGNPLVHIEASATNPETSTNGQYTFYGRYDNPPWNAADNREPLATSFAARYVTGGTFSGGTDLFVWRDSKVSQKAFTCPVVAGTRPAWYPLGQEGIVIFDEQEHPNVAQTFPVSPQPPGEALAPFPAEAQRTSVGGADLPVPFKFGWLYLNLNTVVAAAGNNPPEDPRAAQAWVTVEMRAGGRFSVGFDAVKLDSACMASHFTPGAGG